MSDERPISHIAIISVGNQDLRLRDRVSGKFLALSPQNGEQDRLAAGLGLKKLNICPTCSRPMSDSGAGNAAFGARYLGELILERLGDEIALSDLTYPMIRPFLSNLFQEDPPDKVVLIATDQPSQHSQDTVFIANVIKRLIEEEPTFPRVSVDVQFLVENPQEFSAAYPQVRKLLQPLYNSMQDTADRRVSVLSQGGTPAMTEALTQAAMSWWRYRRCAVYKAKKPRYSELLDGTGESKIEPDDRFPVVRTIGRDIMRAQIDSYGYVDALYTLRGLGFSGDSRRVERLLEYSAARLDLRFEDALGHLPDDPTMDPNPRPRLKLLINGEPRERALSQLAELYWSADVRWQQEELVEFLWRAAAVYELSLHIIVAQVSKEDALWGPAPFQASEVKSDDIKDRPERRQGDFMLECGDWARLATQLCIDESDRNVLTEVTSLRRVWKRRNEALHNAVMPTRKDFAELFVSDAPRISGPDHLRRTVAAILTWCDYGKCDLNQSPYDAVNASLETELNHVLVP